MDSKTAKSTMIGDSAKSLQAAGVVLDEWGNINVAHYQAMAVEMRSEFLSQMFASWRSNAAHAIRALVSSAPVARNV